MKSFSSSSFCCCSHNESIRPDTREETLITGIGSGYPNRQRRAVGRSKSAGHMHWQPALSAISEDGTHQGLESKCQLDHDARCMEIDKARVKPRSRSINTGILYSWRFLFESYPTTSPSPFMF